MLTLLGRTRETPSPEIFGGRDDSQTGFPLLKELTDGLARNPHQSQSLLWRIENLVIHNTDKLIGDLIRNPENQKTYQELAAQLRPLDEDVFSSLRPFLSSIQTVASLLKKGEEKNLNRFTSRMANQPPPIPNARASDEVVLTVRPDAAALHFHDLELPRDFQQVLDIEDQDVSIRILAQLVNRDRVPLDSLPLSKEGMMLLAPHLTYLDCHKLFKGWLIDEVEAFFSKLSFLDVKILKLDETCTITRLPPLPFCEEFRCRSKTLQEITSLSSCKTVDCSNCPNLRKLPIILPECLYFDCSDCPRLEALPALQKCETLQCMFCTFKHLPEELPSLQELNCSNCSNLQALPLLPSARLVWRTDCPSLNPKTIPLQH